MTTIPPIRSALPDQDDAGVAKPTRRSVVQWLAASMALAASGCSEHPQGSIASYAHLPEIEANGTPLYYASACLRDGFARGVLVGTQQGRPVKVEGNPAHPASLGGTDAIAQAEVLQLWDPDRSRTVQRRSADGRSEPSTWQAFHEAWRAHGQDAPNAPLHVLMGRSTSPTEAALLAQLLEQRPGSRWYRDTSPGDRARQDGAMMAFGMPVHQVMHFDRAEVIVALGCDPFCDAASGVRQAADWARVRGEAISANKAPVRLLALETMPGLFGARADERWALSPPAIEAVLWRAAARALPDWPVPERTHAAGSAGTVGVDESAISEAADRIAALLLRHRGRALLCGGDALSASGHAVVAAINQRFGADCWAAIAPPDLDPVLPAPGTLRELVQAIDAGSVGALLVLGCNPAYTSPMDLGLASRIAQVPLTMHSAMHLDETAQLCRWHLPAGHVFEQWGDARAFDGAVSLLQPAIAPLYDTRSPLELLALLAGDGAPEGRVLVRAHWQAKASQGDPGNDFETFWRESLRAGVVHGSASPPLALRKARLPLARPESVDGSDGLGAGEGSARVVWATFPADASVLNGSHANNGWLQELPRPFTKLTWGNALHLGPRTARALGVRTGDVLKVRVAAAGADRQAPAESGVIEAPVWVLPGHAEGSATLPLGYGRRLAGRVGDHVGFDTAPVRTEASGVTALALERTGAHHEFAVTQVEFDEHDRHLARVIAAPLAGAPAPRQPAQSSQPTLYPPIAGQGPAWGMAIDLDACIGCNVCTIACQAENNIPVVGPAEVRIGRAMHWIRVDAYRDEADRVVSQPVPCMHCENAPCELVCPVGATVHDSEGLNVQVYNRCVGTRFCSNNCPYKVRRFNFRQYSDVTTETAKLMHNPDVTVRSRGVMEKCSYCVQRISRARREEQKTGQPNPHDLVHTACQAACPTGAIHFGDLNDPQSDVVRAKASPRHYAMLGELNTRPRTTYLARVDSALPDKAPP